MRRKSGVAEKERDIDTNKAKRERQKRARAKKRLHMLSVAVTAVLVVTLAVSTVWYSILKTELSDEISKKQAQLEQLESETVSLEAEQKNSVDLSYVEDYAENVLGLVKMDRSQEEYLELEKTDQVEVNSGSSGMEKLASSFVKSFSAILSFLR